MLNIRENSSAPKLLFLNQRTPVEAKLSDHNLLIDGDVLSFNIMMQGRWNAEKHRYNNGFANIETQLAYQSRLRNIARVLAEAVELNPQISIIGLVEAPIKQADIVKLISEMIKFKNLRRFFRGLTEELFTSMGVATLVDHQRYDVTYIDSFNQTLRPSLRDRIQQFVLVRRTDGQAFRVFNLHLPYDLAKAKDHVALIRFARALFQDQDAMPVMVMGDFNIDPNVIVKKLPTVSCYIQQKNNILLHANQIGEVVRVEADTVDAIMRSKQFVPPVKSYIDARTRSVTDHLYRSLSLLRGAFALSWIKAWERVVRHATFQEDRAETVMENSSLILAAA